MKGWLAKYSATNKCYNISKQQFLFYLGLKETKNVAKPLRPQQTVGETWFVSENNESNRNTETENANGEDSKQVEDEVPEVAAIENVESLESESYPMCSSLITPLNNFESAILKEVDSPPILEGGVCSTFQSSSPEPSRGEEDPFVPLRSNQVKKTKHQKRNTQSKKIKSLQEDMIESIKAFEEKIVMRDSFYFCKCSKFSTSTKMKARSHTILCGKKKSMGRPMKSSKCLECSQNFPSRKYLLKHQRNDHRSLSTRVLHA